MNYIIYTRGGSQIRGIGRSEGIASFEKNPEATQLWTGGSLIRERKHKAFAHIKWTLPNGVQAGGDLLTVSDMPDVVIGFPNLNTCKIYSFEQFEK